MLYVKLLFSSPLPVFSPVEFFPNPLLLVLIHTLWMIKKDDYCADVVVAVLCVDRMVDQ